MVDENLETSDDITGKLLKLTMFTGGRTDETKDATVVAGLAVVNKGIPKDDTKRGDSREVKALFKGGGGIGGVEG